MADSPRWCDYCKAWGDHHTDRCPTPTRSSENVVERKTRERRYGALASPSSHVPKEA